MTTMDAHASLDRAAQSFLQAIEYLQGADQAKLAQGLERACEWHDGQKRDSGEPYVTHPIAVATYLAGLEAERDTLIAALLHDVIEDERATTEDVRSEFGDDVARLVEGVTKLTKFQYEGRRSERQIASLRKMLIQGSQDLRVICIKLADRWHNIMTIEGVRPDKRLRIAQETLDIYAPLARIVGLWELKELFEERCFPLALPEEHTKWHHALRDARGKLHEERMAFVAQLNMQLKEIGNARLSLSTEYELYQKLRGNPERLSDTHTIDSVLILLRGSKNPISCYQALGTIHQSYPVHTLHFRDYISTPQPNGYRALHTVIFLSQGHELRLRIQTEEMYEHASRRKISTWLLDKSNDVYAALASVQAAHREREDNEQFISDVRTNVLDRMNVFTTWGEIVTLPRRATGIDFAFAVHPDDVVNLTGIRVNGDLRPATQTLNDGDTVELVLLEENKPEMRALWLERMKSAEAREKLKNHLSQSPLLEQQEAGRSLIEHECRKRKLPLWPLFRMPRTQKALLQELGIPTFIDLLSGVGTGLLSVNRVLEAYANILEESQTIVQKILRFFHLLPRERVRNRTAQIIKIEVLAEDRARLIYDITKCIAERNLNIAQFGVFAVPPSDALYKITLEVPDFNEFSDLYDDLLQIPNVKNVLRKR